MDITPSAVPLARGTTLTDPGGRSFELLALLGRGGFGEVHLARMRSAGGLDQHVAIKLLQKGLDPRSQAVERLRDEARLLVSLRHPVVLAAHDLVELGGRVALVTEFIEGQDLTDCIRGEDRLPTSALLEVVEQVASALDAAWNQLRVVHRDVKPQNIRIGVHGNVKLLDFGIARSGMTDRAAQTTGHMLVGTLRYLAPERFDFEHDPRPASDIFALGCVLFEGLTGRALFRRLDMNELFRLSVSPEESARFVRERLDGVEPPLPEPLRGLLSAMLSYDEAARPTAGEVARWCDTLGAQWPEPIPLRRWCRARQWPPSPLGPADRSVPPTPALPSVPPPAPAVEPSPPDPFRDATNSQGGESMEVSLPREEGPLAPAAPGRSPFGWARWAAATSLLSGVLLGALGVALLSVVLLLQLRGPDEPPAQTLPPLAPAPELAAGLPEMVPLLPEVAPLEVVLPEPEPEPEPEPLEEARPVAERPTRRTTPGTTPGPNPVPKAAPSPAAPTYEVVLTSLPLGAEVRLASSGELLGVTPFRKALPAGSVAVRLVAPGGASTQRTLQIGKNSPRRYVWYVAEDRVESGY
jgi:serine/threonine protein kinase